MAKGGKDRNENQNLLVVHDNYCSYRFKEEACGSVVG
jgi:hypothetical protein